MLSSIILAIGVKMTIMAIEANWPMMMNGYSTGWPPIQDSHLKSTIQDLCAHNPERTKEGWLAQPGCLCGEWQWNAIVFNEEMASWWRSAWGTERWEEHISNFVMPCIHFVLFSVGAVARGKWLRKAGTEQHTQPGFVTKTVLPVLSVIATAGLKFK